MTRSTTRRFAFLLLLAGAAGTSGCAKKAEPTKDEASLRHDDRALLEAVVVHDVEASKAMRAADDAAQKGSTAAALDILAKQAVPAVDEGLRAVGAIGPQSAWGKLKRDELTAVLRDRKAEMPRYQEALTSDDPEKMLEVIQAQATIERRALAVVAGLSAQ